MRIVQRFRHRIINALLDHRLDENERIAPLDILPRNTRLARDRDGEDCNVVDGNHNVGPPDLNWNSAPVSGALSIITPRSDKFAALSRG